jgi:hypothetical protein
MTLAGRAGDEDGANAVGGQKRRLNSHSAGRNVPLCIEGRVHGGDEVVKWQGQSDLHEMVSN